MRNACGSPLEQNNGGGDGRGERTNNFFGNASSSSSSSTNTVTGGGVGNPGVGGTGPNFGAQSFASAVGGTDRSNSSNSSTSNHGGKFFEDQPKGPGGVDSILMNGPKGGNNGMENFYNNFDNILGYNNAPDHEARDAYSLFPSSFSMSKLKNQT